MGTGTSASDCLTDTAMLSEPFDIAKKYQTCSIVALRVVSFAAFAAIALACGTTKKNAEPSRDGPVVTIVSAQRLHAGEDLVASVRIANIHNLGGFRFTLTFSSTQVSFRSVDQGSFLSSTGRVPYCQSSTTLTALTYACATKEPLATPPSSITDTSTAGPTGDGELALVHFQVGVGVQGAIEIRIADLNIVDPRAETILATSSGTKVDIQ